MTESDNNSLEKVRSQIAFERYLLAESIGRLQSQVSEARRRPIPTGLPLLAGAALAGFLVAGGIRSTIHLLAFRHRRRKQREELGIVGAVLGS